MEARVCLVVVLAVLLPVASQHEEGTVLREVLAKRQIYSYHAYKDVQIFHFSVPPHVSQAVYNFTANDSMACDVRNITVYLQAQSYPVVNPDGAEFPRGLWVNRSRVYEMQLRSDLQPTLLSVPCPLAGDWFMVAFINQASNRITQAGLFPSCYYWLQADVQYHQETNIATIVPEVHLVQKINKPQYYRFYVPSETWLVVVNISECMGNTVVPSCPVQVAFRTGALPLPGSPDTIVRSCEAEGVDGDCTLEFVPVEEAWHYLQLIATHGSLVPLSMAINFFMCEYVEGSRYQLSRVDQDQPCLEEWLTLEDLGQGEALQNTTQLFARHDLNSSQDLWPESWEAAVPPPQDLLAEDEGQATHLSSTTTCWPKHTLVKKTFGGNFVFEFDLPPNDNGSVPVLLNISNASPTLLTFSLEPIIDIGGTLFIELAISPFSDISQHNLTVWGCLTLRRRAGQGCVLGHQLRVNTTSLTSAHTSVMVPFPEPGPWYLTMVPTCYLTNTSEETNCSSEHTTILFSVSSASCLQGKCGKYGACYQYISGGFIFSTCVCDAGYRGWGCTDDAEATPNWELLLATLLLTLSNLFFLPAVILALKRHYFPEALVYTFTMFFSAFYHACDQEVYNFCLMRLSVMQFCDFYSAIFSFWVTLIVMADLPHNLYSFLHVAGALIVALGVEYDRTGLWVFVVPALSAFLVMSSSWVWHCKQQGECFPSKKYWLTCLLPGVLLAVAGLICYAFLETHDNYYYVHSVWHATMALAILCLLPPRRHKEDKDEDVQPVLLLGTEDVQPVLLLGREEVEGSLYTEEVAPAGPSDPPQPSTLALNHHP